MAGFALWFTGLPASGKTTLARAVQEQLAEHAVPTVLLDSDELRQVLTPQPRYTADERDWFYSVIAYLAAWLTASNVNVLIAATAHRRHYRDAARQQIGRFAEIYVTCELAVCQQRDPKGIYALAATGAAATVPGLGADYEPPLQPEATVDTTTLSVADAAAIVMATLATLRLIPYNHSGKILPR